MTETNRIKFNACLIVDFKKQLHTGGQMGGQIGNLIDRSMQFFNRPTR